MALACRGHEVKIQRTLLAIAAAIFVSTLGADAPDAEETSLTLSPQALQEIAQVEAEIDRIEAQAAERLAAPPDNQIQQIELLGKLMLYDKQLSVNRNEACAIGWPGEVEPVCDRPGPPTAGGPLPVHLGPIDRGRAATTFDQMAQSIAGYEASAEVTPFTSKFDAVLAKKAQFTPQEQAGYDLFRGKGRCNERHRDGGPGEDPLFTDFTASNIGTPTNPRLPYY